MRCLPSPSVSSSVSSSHHRRRRCCLYFPCLHPPHCYHFPLQAHARLALKAHSASRDALLELEEQLRADLREAEGGVALLQVLPLSPRSTPPPPPPPAFATTTTDPLTPPANTPLPLTLHINCFAAPWGGRVVTDGTTCRRCRATADTDRHNAQEDIGRLSKDWARSAARPARGAAGGPLESPQATGALLLSPPGTASSHRLLAGDSLPATPPFRLAPPTPMVPGPPTGGGNPASVLMGSNK